MRKDRWTMDDGRWTIGVLLFVFCFLSVGCSPLYAEVVEGIVAVVNEEVITRYDLEEYLAPLYFQYKSEYQGKELEERLRTLQKDGLRQLIEEKLLLSEAKRLKIKVDGKEVERRLDRLKGRFKSDEEFYDTLTVQGLTEDDLEDRYRDQLMIQQLIEEQVRAWISVSPQEVDQYYQTHQEEFNVPERVKVRNILIRAQTEEEEEEAFIRVHELILMLDQGKSFEEVAKQYSEGPNAAEGGLMGAVARGELAKELDDVVFFLPMGGVSDVVKSPLGYHILKAEEKIPAQVKSLAEVQQEIRQHLFQQKTEIRYQSFLGQLRAKSYISLK